MCMSRLLVGTLTYHVQSHLFVPAVCTTVPGDIIEVELDASSNVTNATLPDGEGNYCPYQVPAGDTLCETVGGAGCAVINGGPGGLVIGGSCSVLCSDPNDYAKITIVNHNQYDGNTTTTGAGIKCAYTLNVALTGTCVLRAQAACCVVGGATRGR